MVRFARASKLERQLLQVHFLPLRPAILLVCPACSSDSVHRDSCSSQAWSMCARMSIACTPPPSCHTPPPSLHVRLSRCLGQRLPLTPIHILLLMLSRITTPMRARHSKPLSINIYSRLCPLNSLASRSLSSTWLSPSIMNRRLLPVTRNGRYL